MNQKLYDPDSEMLSRHSLLISHYYNFAVFTVSPTEEEKFFSYC